MKIITSISCYIQLIFGCKFKILRIIMFWMFRFITIYKMYLIKHIIFLVNFSFTLVVLIYVLYVWKYWEKIFLKYQLYSITWIIIYYRKFLLSEKCIGEYIKKHIISYKLESIYSSLIMLSSTYLKKIIMYHNMNFTYCIDADMSQLYRRWPLQSTYILLS